MRGHGGRFQRAHDIVLDVCSGQWAAKVHSTTSTGAPMVEDVWHEIEECERWLAELRRPKMPPFNLAEVTRIAVGQLPWVWQSKAVLASLHFTKTDTAEATS